VSFIFKFQVYTDTPTSHVLQISCSYDSPTRHLFSNPKFIGILQHLTSSKISCSYRLPYISRLFIFQVYTHTPTSYVLSNLVFLRTPLYFASFQIPSLYAHSNILRFIKSRVPMDFLIFRVFSNPTFIRTF